LKFEEVSGGNASGEKRAKVIRYKGKADAWGAGDA
jgi:hypothetical protein